ncbi:phage holin family protein [Candidatus Kaiserbacteria bacterium]|nr:phage holin family protein [Candidatus Kaiserbacteria bacterium]
MKFIARVLLVALALLVIAEYVSGIHIEGGYAAVISALILSILNGIVRPVLIILTFPITILTLGLFILVINASLFWFAASFIEGFSVDGFLPALIGSVIISIISTIGQKFI